MSKETEKEPKPLETPAQEKPKEAERTPTPEELEADAAAFSAAFGFGQNADKKPKEKTLAPYPVKPAAPEPEKQDEPKKPDEPKPKVKPPTRAELLERLRKLEERGSAPDPEVEPEKPKQAEKKEESLPEIALEEEDQELVDALKVLERTPKHAGSVKKVMDFWAKEESYIKRWEATHRGEKFDKSSDDHSAFYADEPSFDESEIRLAKKVVRREEIDRAVDEGVQKSLKKNVEPKLKEISRKEALEAATPGIIAAGQYHVASLAASVSDEFSKIVNTKDGPLISEEAVEKMKQVDPELFEILTEMAEPLDIAIKEIAKVSKLPEHYQLNPEFEVQLSSGEPFRPHQYVMDAWGRLERQLVALPKDQQADNNGRQFLPGKVFNERWQSAKPGDRAKVEGKYWTVTPDELSRFVEFEQAQKIKKILARTNARVERLAKKSEAKPETNGKPKDQEKQERQAPRPSPSTASASDLQDNSIRGGKEVEEDEEKLQKVFFT